MRSLRRAARKVAVFHLPGTFDEALAFRGPAAPAGHIGLRPEPALAEAGVSSMNTSRLSIMSP